MRDELDSHFRETNQILCTYKMQMLKMHNPRDNPISSIHTNATCLILRKQIT